MSAQYYSEHVCVAIVADDIPSEVAQERLGADFPIRVTRWNQGYLAAIRQLRPSVIVVVDAEQESARESALLLMVLLDRYAPTIATLTLPTPPPEGEPSPPYLMIWSLGYGVAAQIPGHERLLELLVRYLA